ncbi:glycoside hydrolase superfamily [Cunninghamella echinulata]|nr:glycoside hydrolase superfamily [Cunninghamella echinulata]
MLQLYTEDTYEVESEPLFGYMRGKYTRRDLCCIDDFAYDLGIEAIPCIQTLGHLGQVLQWPHYAHLRDNTEVLLAEFEPTYEFIERLISAATGPFRSKRIHLGMDETYGLGEGRYRQIFGYKEPTKIFLQHLNRVMEICSRYSLQPMIWSDMLFCLAAKNNSLQGYYDQDNNPANSGELVESMPSDIDLVFWDYYHTNQDVYEHKLRQHRDLGCNQVWLANGAWSWSRFWTALPFTFQSIRASVLAAKNKNTPVKNSFITIWGDEGNECDIFSALPAILYYAQLGYCDEDNVDFILLKQTFDGICGGNFDDWVYASKIDDSPAGNIITSRTHFVPNTSKWLLWEDPMLGFLTPQYMEEDLETHYSQIAEHLFSAIRKKIEIYERYPLNDRLELPARIAKVLSLKCHLRQKCVTAYKNKDYMTLYDIAMNRLLPLRKEVDGLWEYHRQLWMQMYRPFGWEVLELRYGGLRARLATMFDRIIQFIEHKNITLDQHQPYTNRNIVDYDNELDQDQDNDVDIDDDDDNDETDQYDLPEFDVDLQYLYVGSKTNMLLDYSRVVSPSRPG